MYIWSGEPGALCYKNLQYYEVWSVRHRTFKSNKLLLKCHRYCLDTECPLQGSYANGLSARGTTVGGWTIWELVPSGNGECTFDGMWKILASVFFFLWFPDTVEYSHSPWMFLSTYHVSTSPMWKEQSIMNNWNFWIFELNYASLSEFLFAVFDILPETES